MDVVEDVSSCKKLLSSMRFGQRFANGSTFVKITDPKLNVTVLSSCYHTEKELTPQNCYFRKQIEANTI